MRPISGANIFRKQKFHKSYGRIAKGIIKRNASSGNTPSRTIPQQIEIPDKTSSTSHYIRNWATQVWKTTSASSVKKFEFSISRSILPQIIDTVAKSYDRFKGRVVNQVVDSYKWSTGKELSSTVNGERTLNEAKVIPSTNKQIQDFVKEQENEFESALKEMLSPQEDPPKTVKCQEKPVMPLQIPDSKVALQKRSQFLVRSLKMASSSSSQLLRLEELCKHLMEKPETKGIIAQEGAIPLLLNIKKKARDESLVLVAREALTLLGFTNPPSGSGIRILSIDGGGVRGMLTIQILRDLEERTGKRIYELFDYICGTSTGAILSLLIGGSRASLDKCEKLYSQFSSEVFQRSLWWGTGRLVWTHSYYDTVMWEGQLKSAFQECTMLETARNSGSPKIAAISAIMNLPTIQPYIFRNYALPPRVQSHYLGSCSHKLWQAIRASGAAPGYFQEYCLDGFVHQDGGILVNNPTAIALQEAKLLWPNENIQCVLSLGNGKYLPAEAATAATASTSTSLKTKVMKLIDSATDTEAVHYMLHDLLPAGSYFRLNPYLSEPITLDENRPEKLEQLKKDAKMYLLRNEVKFSQIISALRQSRSPLQKACDWLKMQSLKLS